MIKIFLRAINFKLVAMICAEFAIGCVITYCEKSMLKSDYTSWTSFDVLELLMLTFVMACIDFAINAYGVKIIVETEKTVLTNINEMIMVKILAAKPHEVFDIFGNSVNVEKIKNLSADIAGIMSDIIGAVSTVFDIIMVTYICIITSIGCSACFAAVLIGVIVAYYLNIREINEYRNQSRSILKARENLYDSLVRNAFEEQENAVYGYRQIADDILGSKLAINEINYMFNAIRSKLLAFVYNFVNFMCFAMLYITRSPLVFAKMQRVSRMVNMLGSIYNRTNHIFEKYGEIIDIIDKLEIKAPLKKIVAEKSIIIEKLRFRYKGMCNKKGFEIWLKHKMALEIGYTYCIAGDNGSGKSTFYGCLSNKLNCQEHSIYCIDGNGDSVKIESIENLSVYHAHQVSETSVTGLSFQKFLGVLNSDDIIEILGIVGLSDKINANDICKGDTMIPELSGGQAKRLEYARIMGHLLQRNKYNIVIIDEPSNHVDSKFGEIFKKIISWIHLHQKCVVLITDHHNQFDVKSKFTCRDGCINE